MKLSRRLEALIRLVPEGSAVLDVGCDHAYVPIALVERGISPCAVASDVRPGPLQAAREHIIEAGLSEKIRTRLADGVPEDLSAGSFPPAEGAVSRTQSADGTVPRIQSADGTVPRIQSAEGAVPCTQSAGGTVSRTQSADGAVSRTQSEAEDAAFPLTLITAGMGGLMIRDILRNMTQPPGFFSYILISPQRDADAARYALAALCYRIIDEKMVKEDGKYYPLILSKYAAPLSGAIAEPLPEPLAGPVSGAIAEPLPEPLAGPVSGALAGPLSGKEGTEDSRAAKANAEGGISLTREEALFGPVLMRVRSDVFLECLEKKLREAREILANLPQSASSRRAEIEEEIGMLLDVLYTEA